MFTKDSENLFKDSTSWLSKLIRPPYTTFLSLELDLKYLCSDPTWVKISLRHKRV